MHDDKPSATPKVSLEISSLTAWVSHGQHFLKIKRGVNMGEGDGTVSLISLGGMCVEGWKRKTWNPAGVRIVTKEVCLRLHSVFCVLAHISMAKMQHLPEALDPRGGATTSDHIDILGSQALNEAVLQVAAGRGDEIREWK